MFKETIRNYISLDIKYYFEVNKNSDILLPTVRDASKVVIRGKLIAEASYLKREKESQKKELIDKIKELKALHKKKCS